MIANQFRFFRLFMEPLTLSISPESATTIVPLAFNCSSAEDIFFFMGDIHEKGISPPKVGFFPSRNNKQVNVSFSTRYTKSMVQSITLLKLKDKHPLRMLHSIFKLLAWQNLFGCFVASWLQLQRHASPWSVEP